MEYLWAKSPQAVMELVRALGEKSGWSKSTVVTMVGRLEARETISFQQGHRVWIYTPLIARETAARQETESLLHRVYRGSVGVIVHTRAGGNCHRRISLSWRKFWRLSKTWEGIPIRQSVFLTAMSRSHSG